MMMRHILSVAVVVAVAATGTACSGTGPSSAEVADTSGPGVYGATTGVTGICPKLGYQPFAELLGTPRPTTITMDRTSRTDVSRTTACAQNIGHQPGGSLDPAAPQGDITTLLTYWKDVDTAKSLFATTQDNDGRPAKEGATTAVTGVGTEAYRYTLKQSADGAVTLFLVSRSSNLVLTVQLTAISATPWSDQQLHQLFDRMGDHAKAVFPIARHAAPPPTGTP
ncbi:hypothetical protein ACGFX4_07600 [Kitasatospora sp. NPDC048365]|uniref:hypothetical protein n=1 Tax=Kitasatospora sp. NPDC048365 TaxID=3364050 RepID=UPI00372280CA